MSEQQTGSILAADFGNTHTRVLLFDLVGGSYRLVASGMTRTTAGPPIDNVGVGLTRMLQQFKTSTGRNLLNRDGTLITPEQPDRSGVDFFLTTSSVGRPMRAMIVGLAPDVSIASARRAVAGSYIEIVDVIHPGDGRSEEERLNVILLGRTDLLFIVGGTDGGAQRGLLELVQVARLALQLMPAGRRPELIYAGNSALAEYMRDQLSRLSGFYLAANLRPEVEDEQLGPVQQQLNRAFTAFGEQRGEDFQRLVEMSSTGIMPTAQSFSLMTQFIASSTNGRVIGLDVGSASTTFVSSSGGRSYTDINTDVGMGQSIFTLLEQVDMDKVRRWLPFYAPRMEIVNYALNKSLRPATLPISPRELYIEQALLRAGAAHVMQQAEAKQDSPEQRPELVISGGTALNGSGTPAFDMLLLLDILQPEGITHFRADPDGVLPALGAMAQINPEAVVQLVDSGVLHYLGTSISVSGRVVAERTAIKLTIRTEDGEEFPHELAGGHLWTLPLPAGRELEISIRCARGVHIGGRRRLKMRFRGGTAGLIFDARGRPLPLAATAAGRAQQIPLWIQEATGYDLPPIPEEWLTEPEEAPEEVAEAAAEKKTRRGRRRGRREERAAAPAATAMAEQIGDDDEFFDLISGEEEEKSKDDLGALRDVLS